MIFARCARDLTQRQQQIDQYTPAGLVDLNGPVARRVRGKRALHHRPNSLRECHIEKTATEVASPSENCRRVCADVTLSAGRPRLRTTVNWCNLAMQDRRWRNGVNDLEAARSSVLNGETETQAIRDTVDADSLRARPEAHPRKGWRSRRRAHPVILLVRTLGKMTSAEAA